jgi:WD40 repeat protein
LEAHVPRAQNTPYCTGKLGWKLEQTLAGHHSRTVFSVDWSAAGWIASGAGDNSICIFARQQAQQQEEVAAASKVPPEAAAASPTGNDVAVVDTFAAAAADGVAAPAADGATPAPHHSYQRNAATQEAGSSPAQQQAQRQPQQTQSLFQPLTQRTDAHAADVNCVRWHPTDSSLLASASDDNTIKLWRLQS